MYFKLIHAKTLFFVSKRQFFKMTTFVGNFISNNSFLFSRYHIFLPKWVFFNKVWNFMTSQKCLFFDENSISKVLKKLFSGWVMWQSDSICYIVSIFDSIWKLNLKTSEFSRLSIRLRKRTKTLKFHFSKTSKNEPAKLIFRAEKRSFS